MSEDNSTSFFSEVEEDEIMDAEEIPDQHVGVCSDCLGSGYKIRQRNGVLGVLFTSNTSDSEGKPIRRLVPCDCRVEVSY